MIPRITSTGHGGMYPPEILALRKRRQKRITASLGGDIVT